MQKNLRDLPDHIKKAGLEAVAAELERDKQSLVPGAVRYPIQWTSDRQRRYVMAMLREQDNLSYKRTGETVNSIHFKYGQGGGSDYVAAETESPYAPFVVGQYQQKFHRNTGWKTIPEWMTSQRRKVVGTFKTATDKLIREFNRWMYGGSPGI